MESKDRVMVVSLAVAIVAIGLPASIQASPTARLISHASPFSKTRVWADDAYPLQGSSSFIVEATLTKVDVERDRLSLTADNGRKYVADAYDTKIFLIDRSGKGEVGDLVPGMRVRVKGYLLSADIIAADQLRVLPLEKSTDEQPKEAAKPASPARSTPPKTAKIPTGGPRYFHPEPIKLRGTVDSVDDEHGTVVVRVKDHTRTVLVSSTTDLTDITDIDDNRIGINVGDRVTVQGMLQANGSVKATGISRSREIEKVVTRGASQPDLDHQIIGHVSRTSNKLTDRDIKVTIRPGHEIEVRVGHRVVVLRHGEPISVHDLTRDDIVRIDGDYDPDSEVFNATQIEVLEAYPPM